MMKYNLIEKSKPVDLSSYFIFNKYDEVKISNYFQIDIRKECKILKLKTYNYFPIDSSGKVMDDNVESKHIYGSFLLLKNYGNLYLRQEKFEDKIADFFNSVDIDFKNHKEFSKKFYLIGDNRDLIIRNFSTKLLDFSLKIKDLELEIINNRCFFSITRLPSTNLIENATVENCIHLEKLFNE